MEPQYHQNILHQVQMARQQQDTRHLAIQKFPSLTQEEFRDACHYLDRRYTQATLGILRTQFALSVHNMSFNDSITWTRIVKPIILSKTDDIELSHALENMCWGGEGGGQIDMLMDGIDGESRKLMDVDAEDADMRMVAGHPPPSEDEATPESGSETPPRYTADPQQPYAVYEIHLHETYRMPTLWFSLHDLPPGDKEFDVEAVYRYLVPDQHKAVLRSSGFGPGGALSAAPHPVTGIPCFFVHPCQATDAMAPWESNVTLENYLMIWLGMQGNAVGLHLPVQMAQLP